MSANMLHNKRQLRARQNFLASTYEKLLPVMLAIVAYGCTSEAGNLQSELINASVKSKTERISLDVSNFLAEKIKKICIQHQYMTEKSFVELTEMSSPDFKDLSFSEGEFVLWIYFESRPPIQIHLKRGELIPPENQGVCTKSSVLQIEQKTIVFN